MIGVRFCTACGNELHEQDTFCNRCGSAIFLQASESSMPLAPPLPPPPPPPSSLPKLIVLIVVAILVLSSIGYVMLSGWTDPQTESTLGYGSEQYEWYFDGVHYTMMVNVPLNDYQDYADDPIARGLDSQEDNTLAAQFVTSQDPTVHQIAEQMLDVAADQNMDELTLINCVLRFVQSINYSYDIDSTGMEEYWRFPVETLYDHTGDCEDKSFLFASVLEALGQDAIIIIYDDHVAVGVRCADASGTYYTESGMRYFYCETTSIGWAVGDIPKDRSSAHLVQVE